MSVNKVILVGNVGKDPEVRYVDQNTPVANFTLATTERGYTTQTGTVVPDRTEWHNIVVWRGLAKVVESYVRKGTSLYIEGKIRTRNWQDQNGVTRYTTEIYADDLQLLGKRPEGGVAPLTAPQAGAQQPQYQSQPVSTPSAPNFGSDNEDSSGDLPF
ncbi:MAG: single-stranded DNA-binding protein [Prevotellaceae bacterium]|jgi:single-strand DNA-binding protein|nr:single-stranded DNA-binding protein [Prevotellaceae bacterium]